MESIQPSPELFRCPTHWQAYTLYCMNCKQMICVNCVPHHNKLRHEITNKEDAASSIVANLLETNQRLTNLRADLEQLLATPDPSNFHLELQTGMSETNVMFQRILDCLNNVQVDAITKCFTYLEFVDRQGLTRKGEYFLKEIERTISQVGSATSLHGDTVLLFWKLQYLAKFVQQVEQLVRALRHRVQTNRGFDQSEFVGEALFNFMLQCNPATLVPTRVLMHNGSLLQSYGTVTYYFDL